MSFPIWGQTWPGNLILKACQAAAATAANSCSIWLVVGESLSSFSHCRKLDTTFCYSFSRDSREKAHKICITHWEGGGGGEHTTHRCQARDNNVSNINQFQMSPRQPRADNTHTTDGWMVATLRSRTVSRKFGLIIQTNRVANVLVYIFIDTTWEKAMKATSKTIKKGKQIRLSLCLSAFHICQNKQINVDAKVTTSVPILCSVNVSFDVNDVIRTHNATPQR